MRRLVLILGLAVAAWLGRRQLRSAAHAQRYLTLLTLLQIIAVMGKTSASAKAVNTENRLGLHIAGVAANYLNNSGGTVSGSVEVTGAITDGLGNAYLRVAQQSPPANAGAAGSAIMGAISGTVTTGNVNTIIGNVNQLTDWSADMAADYNTLIATLRSSHVLS